MPGLITALEFVEETKDDYHSPTTSTFVEKMTNCRQTVSCLEESLDFDREGLVKMKKAIKSIYNGGIDHFENELSLSKSLEKLGANAMSKDSEPDIGAAFIKFSIVTKELSSLMKALMQNLNNIVLYPLDNILKGELKGVKGELKKPFERAWRDYEAKILKIEKEKKQQAKEAGLIRTEISSAEIADEMDKERKAFQLQMCEYLLKVNDIKTKKGVDLLQHLVEYYHAQSSFFQDGLKTIEHFNTYINELSNKLDVIKTAQDEERKQLIDLKNLLNNGENGINLNSFSNFSSFTNSFNSSANSSNSATNSESNSKKEKSLYNLHQLQGNKNFGYNKTGYLLKKSEGKMKMKVWQKRKCEIKESFLYIYHSDESKSPVKINLLTCQVKIIPDEKRFFDLMSFSRTYHFQAEDENDAEAWICVLINCKEEVLKKEFDKNKTIKNSVVNNEDYPLAQSLNELRKNIILSIRKQPGNQKCVDCNSTKDATWLSINFGIIVCIECSGIHRDLGVHVSRIQSLTLDNIGLSQLLLANIVSNEGFNSIYEANLDIKKKIKPDSSMDERCTFIRSKYIKKKFIKNLSTNNIDVLKKNLEQALLSKNIYQLLQCHAENADFNWVLPSFINRGDTALHTAIAQEDNYSLHIIDFLIQNTSNLNKQNSDGNTAVHVSILNNKSEPLKLLLRSSANITVLNNDKKTPIDLAKELNHLNLLELLQQSQINKKTLLFENLDINWNLSNEENLTDFSDEDLNEEKNLTKDLDFLFNSRHSLPITSSLLKQKEFYNSTLLNNCKKTSNDTNHSLKKEKLIQNNFINSISQDCDFRSSSVLDQFQVKNHNILITANKLNSKFDNDDENLKIKPPPLPPHNKNPITNSNLYVYLNNNNNHKSNNLNVINSDKEHFKKTLSTHSRTISDSGLKPLNNKLENCSLDIQINNSSFINYHPKNIIDKNCKKHVYVDNCSQLSLDESFTTQRPNLPPPPIPPSNHQTNSQNNLNQSNNFIQNQFINSLNTKPNKNNNLLRKKKIFIENRHLSNGQSFESLPSVSSEDLNNSNNSCSNQNNICSSNQIGQIISSFDSKYSPVPVPPPRKRQDLSINIKKCIALYDCEADQDDELAFKKDEIILITKEKTNDEDWMEGHIEGNTERKGVFPISFVQMLNQ